MKDIKTIETKYDTLRHQVQDAKKIPTFNIAGKMAAAELAVDTSIELIGDLIQLEKQKQEKVSEYMASGLATLAEFQELSDAVQE